MSKLDQLWFCCSTTPSCLVLSRWAPPPSASKRLKSSSQNTPLNWAKGSLVRTSYGKTEIMIQCVERKGQKKMTYRINLSSWHLLSDWLSAARMLPCRPLLFSAPQHFMFCHLFFIHSFKVRMENLVYLSLYLKLQTIISSYVHLKFVKTFILNLHILTKCS